jgi:hypothetical protein
MNLVLHAEHLREKSLLMATKACFLRQRDNLKSHSNGIAWIAFKKNRLDDA